VVRDNGIVGASLKTEVADEVELSLGIGRESIELK
jgi:hypothetical protein